MKTIGLIGGMSWESTQYYYQLMNRYVSVKLGGHHSIEAILYSLNFETILKLADQGKWEAIGKILASISTKLEVAGAELLILTSNTAHKVISQIEKVIHIPILHIADPTAEAIKKNSIEKVGLLGTRVTMEEPFYKTRLKEKYDIETLIPGPSDREILHKIILEELTLGKIPKSSKEKLILIIQRLTEQGAQGIILGCTELTFLIKPEEVLIPLFDTTELHAKAAVDLSLK